jgi:hypothetical protein
MRKWIFLGLVAALLVGGFLFAKTSSMGWMIAVSDLGSNPVVALTRNGGEIRVPVQAFGRPALPGEARINGGQGIRFGTRFGYVMPDGSLIECTMRFRRLTCGGGWTAERAT